MKKTILIIALVSLFSYVKAQEKSLDNIVELSLPTAAEKPNQQKLEIFMQKHKKSEINLKSNKGSIYTIGDIIIQINSGNEKVPSDLLEGRKIFYDDYNKKITTQKNYSSNIKIINNYKTLIVKYDRVNDYSYQLIYAVNYNINDKTIAVRIEYKKEDELKASKIVDHILKNMRFK